jgi:hypothetical protein
MQLKTRSLSDYVPFGMVRNEIDKAQTLASPKIAPRRPWTCTSSCGIGQG